MENYFIELNSIDVSNHTEKKGKLTYLSWAWAWCEIKKHDPEANYTIYQNPELGGMPYFTDGRTATVKTGVTVHGIEHIEMLPVMDNRNKSIPLEQITSFEVNTAIQRSLTKACARHGLGLYIYAGEDLPKDETEDTCSDCGAQIKGVAGKDGAFIPAAKVKEEAMKRTGRPLCAECLKKNGNQG